MTAAVATRERERETRPGAWVAAARAEAGSRAAAARPVSQMRLAVLIGRDRNTVTRWEAADGEVDFVTWLGVLHALSLPADWEPAPPTKRTRVTRGRQPS